MMLLLSNEFMLLLKQKVNGVNTIFARTVLAKKGTQERFLRKLQILPDWKMLKGDSETDVQKKSDGKQDQKNMHYVKKNFIDTESFFD